jgi:hypothetical protein
MTKGELYLLNVVRIIQAIEPGEKWTGIQSIPTVRKAFIINPDITENHKWHELLLEYLESTTCICGCDSLE